MTRRHQPQPIHPLGPVLLFLGIAGVLWPLHYFFGIGTRLYQWAAAAGLFFVASILFTLVVVGLIWGAIKLFGSRK